MDATLLSFSIGEAFSEGNGQTFQGQGIIREKVVSLDVEQKHSTAIRNSNQTVTDAAQKREIVLETIAYERTAQIPAEKGFSAGGLICLCQNRGRQFHLAADHRNHARPIRFRSSQRRIHPNKQWSQELADSLLYDICSHFFVTTVVA